MPSKEKSQNVKEIQIQIFTPVTLRSVEAYEGLLMQNQDWIFKNTRGDIQLTLFFTQ